LSTFSRLCFFLSTFSGRFAINASSEFSRIVGLFCLYSRSRLTLVHTSYRNRMHVRHFTVREACVALNEEEKEEEEREEEREEEEDEEDEEDEGAFTGLDFNKANKNSADCVSSMSMSMSMSLSLSMSMCVHVYAPSAGKRYRFSFFSFDFFTVCT